MCEHPRKCTLGAFYRSETNTFFTQNVALKTMDGEIEKAEIFLLKIEDNVT